MHLAELFSTSLKSAKTNDAKEYFYKVAKYFEIIYEYADEKQKLESLKNFRENFEKIKQKAKEKLDIIEFTQKNQDLDYMN